MKKPLLVSADLSRLFVGCCDDSGGTASATSTTSSTSTSTTSSGAGGGGGGPESDILSSAITLDLETLEGSVTLLLAVVEAAADPADIPTLHGLEPSWLRDVACPIHVAALCP